MSQSADKRFYVLRAMNGKEKEVCTYINTALGLVDKDGNIQSTPESEIKGVYVYRVLIPMEKVMTQRDRKKIVKERPCLPGYVLVEAVLEAETEHWLKNIPNVFGFLNSNGTPSPLSKAEVNRLLGAADEMSDSTIDSDVSFIVGETVKIIDGAFSTFDAIIEEVLTERRRLKVMVKIFGRKTPLELSYEEVVKE